MHLQMYRRYKSRMHSRCVGYCEFDGHSGYLTEKLRNRHDCLQKNCRYYVPKTYSSSPKNDKSSERKISSEILRFAREELAEEEAVYAVRAELVKETWCIFYFTITNDYDLSEATADIRAAFGIDVEFKRLNYSFDVCENVLLNS